jgi:arginyl-tRNA synthetase
MKLISDTIQQSITDVFGVEQYVSISRPDESFGDYATNVAMQLSKLLAKSPREVADRLAENLSQNSLFSEVSVAGPGFINLRIGARSLHDFLVTSWSDGYGRSNDGQGRTAIVEFPSQNMAKPYSIGHLRPGNQGWAAKRLLEETGWKVITDNHLGDSGTPFGVWAVGFTKFSSQERLAKDGVYELGRVYIETKKALKDEEARGDKHLAEEVQLWLQRLEQGDSEAVGYSKMFNEISLRHIHDVMSRLKISTDYEYGEAFYVAKGKLAVGDLLAKGIAEKNDDNSVVVRLDEFGIDTPMLVQKSNGTALYATTDLATLLFREESWHPDRVIYAVGSEQQFYFQQLFALAKKIGIETELTHLWFGLIDQINEDGTREKMSSRKGVVLLEDLLDKAEARARKITEGRTVSEDDIKKIAIGAIKFTDFTADRRTNILFDWDNIFALSGFSGPYVQYAAVRLNKILRDHASPQSDASGYDYESEKALILKLIDYPAVVSLSARDLEPHRIATYIYELGREFSRYYEHVPISTGGSSDTEKTARLELIAKISHVFEHGLGILGIEVPESM